MKNNSWFKNSGPGLFIHWGVYSAGGFGEWGMFKRRMSQQEYDSLIPAFTASNYHPREWAKKAKSAGMEYMVLTAKHHDGYCLFKTASTCRNAAVSGPHRDLVREYVEACRSENLKCGIYFSLPDWSIPAFFRGPLKDAKGWKAFLDEIVFTQMRELCSNYGKIDLIWYDNILNLSDGNTHCLYNDNFRDFAENVDSTKRLLTAEDYHSRELNAMVRSLQPDILINDRSLLPEDFYTAEQNLRPPADPERPWEACMTMNRHWGYYPTDLYYKHPFEMIMNLTVVASLGGHMLLNVGPNEKGELNSYEIERLEKIGEWMNTYGEMIKGISRSDLQLPASTFGCAGEKDGRIFLYIHWVAPDGKLILSDHSANYSRAIELKTKKELVITKEPYRVILSGMPIPAPNELPVVELFR